MMNRKGKSEKNCVSLVVLNSKGVNEANET